jgi:hypothetical protein
LPNGGGVRLYDRSVLRGEFDELCRETAEMGLYIAIVELAEMAALRGGGYRVDEARLLELVWGTATGLALAHWFAFRLVARGAGHGRVSRQDAWIGAAQFGAAALVSVLCTIMILVFGGSLRAAATAPALVIAASGFWVARASGRSYYAAVLIAVVVLGLGLIVALVKSSMVH